MEDLSDSAHRGKRIAVIEERDGEVSEVFFEQPD